MVIHVSRKVKKPIDIIPDTKVQYNKQHLMTSAFLTLTKGQGHTTRSMVTDVEVSAFCECFLLCFFFLFNESTVLLSRFAHSGFVLPVSVVSLLQALRYDLAFW